MMSQVRILSVLAAIVLASCSGLGTGGGAAQPKGCQAGMEMPPSEAGLEQTGLCIISGKKVHAFTVEVASTSPQQARGLMFRNELADNKGMIFPFTETRMASFWMKNTFIPLDIIFIRENGKIENIASNTTPYSTDPVESTAPVAAVLELRGGLTAELGIKRGDKVRWTAK